MAVSRALPGRFRPGRVFARPLWTA